MDISENCDVSLLQQIVSLSNIVLTSARNPPVFLKTSHTQSSILHNVPEVDRSSVDHSTSASLAWSVFSELIK